MTAPIDQIKALARQHHFPVFGVASSSYLEHADPGYRPSDLLPSAASIICLGFPVPKGTFACNARAHETYWRAANIYYRTIDAILMEIARILEDSGDTAVPVYG